MKYAPIMKKNSLVVLEIQQNMLPLTFVGHCVDTSRKGSKYSLYIELWLYLTDDAQHAKTNSHI